MLTHALRAAAGNSSGSAPTYVGGRTQTNSGSSTNFTVSLTGLSGGIASSPAAGDLVVVSICTASAAAVTLAVSGYTRLYLAYQNDANDTNLGIFYKFMPSPADTQFAVAATGTSNASAITIQVFRGVDPEIPLGWGADYAEQNTIIPFDTTLFPSININRAGVNGLAMAGGAHTAGVQTYGASSGLTNQLGVGANSTYDATALAGIRTVSPGAFKPGQPTFSTSDSSTYSNISATLPINGNESVVIPFVQKDASDSTVSDLATSVTVTILTSNIQDGDFLLAFAFSQEPNTVITPPSGFSTITSRITGPSTFMFIKTASSETGSYTFTRDVPNNSFGAAVLVIRNSTSYVNTAFSLRPPDADYKRATLISPTITKSGLSIVYCCKDDATDPSLYGFNTSYPTVAKTGIRIGNGTGTIFVINQPACNFAIQTSPATADEKFIAAAIHFTS